MHDKRSTAKITTLLTLGWTKFAAATRLVGILTMPHIDPYSSQDVRMRGVCSDNQARAVVRLEPFCPNPVASLGVMPGQ